jgi:hypothetical protein
MLSIIVMWVFTQILETGSFVCFYINPSVPFVCHFGGVTSTWDKQAHLQSSITHLTFLVTDCVTELNCIGTVLHPWNALGRCLSLQTLLHFSLDCTFKWVFKELIFSNQSLESKRIFKFDYIFPKLCIFWLLYCDCVVFVVGFLFEFC